MSETENQTTLILAKSLETFRIIDFGLAKELGGPEKERCGMDGTLEFMAPEVIRSTYCTTATDMWSLGCERDII